MAGKSTFLRQTALIVIMAQAGFFVPAQRARFHAVDKVCHNVYSTYIDPHRSTRSVQTHESVSLAVYGLISALSQVFSRVGATDDIARDRSSFMTEMLQVTHILRHATRQSLVIMDEVGRGTSTFDGLALACAIVEHLHSVTRCRAFFATHYHETHSLAGGIAHFGDATTAELARQRRTTSESSAAAGPQAGRLGGIACVHVAVERDADGHVMFTHKVRPGAATDSYGVFVARLAGMPDSVTARAERILHSLHSGQQEHRRKMRGLLAGDDIDHDQQQQQQQQQLLPITDQPMDPSRVLSSPASNAHIARHAALVSALSSLDPDSMTPREALKMLYRLRKQAVDTDQS